MLGPGIPTGTVVGAVTVPTVARVGDDPVLSGGGAGAVARADVGGAGAAATIDVGGVGAAVPTGAARAEDAVDGSDGSGFGVVVGASAVVG